MHVHYLDPYLPKESLIHRLDPRIKFVLAISFIFTTALISMGTWPVYVILLAVILSVDVLSELGVGYILKRSILALPFVLAAVPIIFTASGPVLATFAIGSWEISISQVGLERFISIGLKSWISIQAAIVLAASTPFPEILVAMRAIRFPKLIVAIFGLMWRYLFVLVDEVIRLNRARASRSGHPDTPTGKTGGRLIWRAKVTGGMVGSLFLRALERSDRIYMAMVSRGYDGEIRTLPLPGLKPVDWLILIVSLLFLATLVGLSIFLN